MKALKQNLDSIILCMFEVLVGILLLVDPVEFTSGIIIVAGIILIIIGLISVVKYFRENVGEAVVRQSLTKGLIALLIGAFCVVKSKWFIATFPILTIIYGVVILVAGLSKVQVMADMIRMKNKKWFWGAISAALSIVCAIVILNNPFTSTVVLWTFIGISLIVEAVIDMITIIIKGKNSGEAGE